MTERMHRLINGEKVYLSAEEEQEIRAEWTRNEAEAAKTAYADARRAEYPSIAEQLDMQFKDARDGTTKWVDLIASIKAKYPKPSE